MFVGRQRELEALKELYDKDTFELLILYGRRRIGKTCLLTEFFKEKKGVFFLSEENNDALNIEAFSKKLYQYFNVPSSVPLMTNWNDLFSFVSSSSKQEERLLLIIDEFPYLSLENKSLMSKLQHAIDQEWKDKNIFLILCGSSVSFMENEVLGHKSPLFGRRTAQMKLEAFDYQESAAFYPSYSNIDKIRMYATFGGVPQYLSLIDPDKTVEENICKTILQPYSYLFEEPLMLLRTEVRSPSVYYSILNVMGKGATKISDIANKVHEETAKCTKYIQTLCELGIVEKRTPLNESRKSRNTIYQICDPFFHFWYRFIAERQESRYTTSAKQFYDTYISPQFDTYIGLEFEKICTQFIKKQNGLNKLPISASMIGRWWGTNKLKKCEEDVDILLIGEKEAMFCECKWRNIVFDSKEYTDLQDAAKLFDYEKKYYALFSKSGFKESIKKEANNNDCLRLYTIDDLYQK